MKTDLWPEKSEIFCFSTKSGREAVHRFLVFQRNDICGDSFSISPSSLKSLLAETEYVCSPKPSIVIVERDGAKHELSLSFEMIGIRAVCGTRMIFYSKHYSILPWNQQMLLSSSFLFLRMGSLSTVIYTTGTHRCNSKYLTRESEVGPEYSSLHCVILSYHVYFFSYKCDFQF